MHELSNWHVRKSMGIELRSRDAAPRELVLVVESSLPLKLLVLFNGEIRFFVCLEAEARLVRHTKR